MSEQIERDYRAQFMSQTFCRRLSISHIIVVVSKLRRMFEEKWNVIQKLIDSKIIIICILKKHIFFVFYFILKLLLIYKRYI